MAIEPQGAPPELPGRPDLPGASDEPAISSAAGAQSSKAVAGEPGLLSLRWPPSPIAGKLIGLATIAALLLFWWLATRGATPETRLISPVILPSPAEVAGSVKSLWYERGLLPSIVATMRRVLTGFGLAVLVCVPLGIAAGSWRVLEAAAAPVALFGRNVPVAALIPLTILWFGIDETQKIAFIFIACAPFVYSDAVRAIVSVPDRYVETAQTLGASAMQIVWKVLVALALPDIYKSLRSLFGMAFGYIMLAELINAPHGLGAMLNVSQRRGLTEHIFLILALIALIAWAIDHGLAYAERKLFPYRR